MLGLVWEKLRSRSRPSQSQRFTSVDIWGLAVEPSRLGIINVGSLAGLSPQTTANFKLAGSSAIVKNFPSDAGGLGCTVGPDTEIE